MISYLPHVIFIAIVISALLLWTHFSKKINLIKNQLVSFKNEIRNVSKIQYIMMNSSDEHINHLIKSTIENTITINQKDYCLQSHTALWNRKNIFTTINTPLYEAIPNIMIGVGLTFTFTFLAFALNNVNTILTENNDSALINLLSYTGSKFSTSLAGLICSIMWVISSKIKNQQIDEIINLINQELNRLSPPYASEQSIVFQNKKFTQITEQNDQLLTWFKSEFSFNMEKNFSTQTNTLTYHLDRISMQLFNNTQEAINKLILKIEQLESILNKLEGGLASQIGASVAIGLQPVLTRQKEAIEIMANQISHIQETALREMVSLFLKNLTHVSQQEMQDYLHSIRELGATLYQASEKIHDETLKATTFFSSTIENSTQNFERSINNAATQFNIHTQYDLSNLITDYTTRIEEISSTYSSSQHSTAKQLNKALSLSISQMQDNIIGVRRNNDDFNHTLEVQHKTLQQTAQHQHSQIQIIQQLLTEINTAITPIIKIDRQLSHINQKLNSQQELINYSQQAVSNINNILESLDKKILPTAERPFASESLASQISELVAPLLCESTNNIQLFNQIYTQSELKSKIAAYAFYENDLSRRSTTLFQVLVIFLEEPLLSGANTLVYLKNNIAEHRSLAKIFNDIPIGSIIERTIEPAQLKLLGQNIILSEHNIIKKGDVKLG